MTSPCEENRNAAAIWLSEIDWYADKDGTVDGHLLRRPQDVSKALA